MCLDIGLSIKWKCNFAKEGVPLISYFFITFRYKFLPLCIKKLVKNNMTPNTLATYVGSADSKLIS